MRLTVLRVPSLLAAVSFLTLLTGCALQTTATPDFVPGTTISGTVHGGSQPIFGANVYLLAVNPTGYGGPGIAAGIANASISLLKASSTGHVADSIGSYVLTNSTTGGFSLSSDYNCASGFAQSTANTVTLSGSEQVYLYILGGTPQNISSANTSAGFLVALGPCNSPTTQVAVNEITTIASAYAFAGFATDATHIGSSGSSLALTGLTNAFANVANLAAVSSGTATASFSNITTPSQNIITIANILAACVNGATANTQCGTLFQYTASAGATGTAPTDTATAAINVAHNPWPTAAGMTALYGLVPGTGAPFAGGLTAQPTDFTLALNLSGGGLSNPSGIAIDAAGNVWAVNPSSNTLSEFSSAGTALSSSSGYTGGGLSRPTGIAIDAAGNVWTPNSAGNTLSEFSSAGTAISSSSGYTGGGLHSPYRIAIDASGNIWATNTNSLSKFSSSGAAVSGSSGYTGGGLGIPSGIAIDIPGNVWAINSTFNSSLSKFSSSGTAISGSSGYTGGGLSYPFGIAIDASGNVWASNINSLSKFSSAGTAISSSSGYTGGGLNGPQGIAIDGSGNVWASNGNTNSLSEFSNAGTAVSSSSGYTGGGLNFPYGIAIDISGNVWATNNANSTLTELIGAATPVVTPLAANLVSPYGTATVNLP